MNIVEEFDMNFEEFDMWLMLEFVLIGDIVVGGCVLVLEGYILEKLVIVGGGK